MNMYVYTLRVAAIGTVAIVLIWTVMAEYATTDLTWHLAGAWS